MVPTIYTAVCYSSSFVSILSCGLGNIFGTYLFGILTVQLYRYYISFPRDPKLFKVVIYIVYVTETICTFLLIYDLITMIAEVIKFYSESEPGIVTKVVCLYETWIPKIIAVGGGIVAFLTQSMYAYRIRIITKLRYVSWVIVLAMMLQLVTIVIMSFLTSFYALIMMIVWASVSLIVDITITSTMVWFLKKDEIYSKRLEKMIARLIYLMIGTGVLTVATNLCILVLSFYSYPHGFGLLIILSKLYANSMMVLVNSRIPSSRSEINYRATLDMITVRLNSIRGTSQAAANGEHGQRELSFDLPGARGIGLSAHEAGDAHNNDELPAA